MFLLHSKKVHVAFIVLLGAVLYANTLHAPFYLDDYGHIVTAPLIKDFSFFIHPASAKAYLEYGGFVSRYVGYLTFALNYRIGGLDVTGYHLVNIAIHLLASLLVYRLVSLTFRTPFFPKDRAGGTADGRAGFIALFSALLFVAHPLQTQAVTYIVQRFASLAALLYLLSLTCYIRGRLSQTEADGRHLAAGIWFAAALASAVLAVKTKETAYTLPLVVLLYELLFFPRKMKTVIAAAAALFAAAAVCAGMYIVSSGKPFGAIIAGIDSATRLQTDMSRWDYLATECRVLVTYLRLIILPVQQHLDYDYPVYHSFLDPSVLGSVGLLGTLLAAAVVSVSRSRRGGSSRDRDYELLRLCAFGIFWFFVTLSIESSIIPIADVIFEHRMYLPSVGIFIAAAAAVSFFGGTGAVVPGWPRPQFLAAAAAVVVLLGGVTVARNSVWCDEVSFWEDNVWKAPRKARVLLHLGQAREKKGDLQGAEKDYLIASRIDPYRTDPYVNLGLIYIQLNRLDDALEQFRTALKIEPDLAEAHNNMGNVYGMQHKDDEALKEYLQVVKLQPTLAEPYNNIGYLYARKQRYPEAIEQYGKAITHNPDYVQAYINRGMALVATGRHSEAIADFRKALAIDPANTEAAEQLRKVGQGG